MTDDQPKRRGRKPKTTPIEGLEVTEATIDSPTIEDVIQANQEFKEENDVLRQELEALKSMMAKNTPFIKRKLDDFDEAGIQGVVEETSAGFVLPQGDLESPAVKSKLEYEQFMNEMVRVHISESTDNPDHPGFDISVNGKMQIFMYGREHVVKRYFVEGLARAKKTTYGNRKLDERNVGDGENGYEYRAHSGVRYPFSVIDDTRRGTDWLAAIRRQP